MKRGVWLHIFNEIKFFGIIFCCFAVLVLPSGFSNTMPSKPLLLCRNSQLKSRLSELFHPLLLPPEAQATEMMEMRSSHPQQQIHPSGTTTTPPPSPTTTATATKPGNQIKAAMFVRICRSLRLAAPRSSGRKRMMIKVILISPPFPQSPRKPQNDGKRKVEPSVMRRRILETR